MKDTPMTPYRDLPRPYRASRGKGTAGFASTREIDKDSELHPLVRWQFTGGLKEEDRKAFLFTNIRNKAGRRYEIPVIRRRAGREIRAIYATGMGCDVDGIRDKWCGRHREPGAAPRRDGTRPATRSSRRARS